VGSDAFFFSTFRLLRAKKLSSRPPLLTSKKLDAGEYNTFFKARF